MSPPNHHWEYEHARWFQIPSFFPLFKLTYAMYIQIFVAVFYVCIWSFYWSISFGWTINLQYSSLNREHVFGLVNQTICWVRACVSVCCAGTQYCFFPCRIVVKRTVNHASSSMWVILCVRVFVIIYGICRIPNGFKFELFSISFTSLWVCVRVCVPIQLQFGIYGVYL